MSRILIVGAGPVGLALALALAHHGVRSVVIDSEPRGHCEGSRSICVQRHTLEQLERIGAAGRQMAEEGISWQTGRTYVRDREIFSISLGSVAAGAWPPFVNLGQWRVEQLLLEEAERRPEITLRWSARLTDLSADDEGVTAVIDDDVRLRGAYLVGCDGAKSTVRELAGIDFSGHDFSDKFLICDIRAKVDFPCERRFFFDPPFNPGRQVLIHPQPADVWRIDWQVPPSFDLEAERGSDAMDRRIRAVVGEDAEYEIVWASQYTFSQRLASRFRSGRIFLAGDAAHVMTPFGARGLNSGVQDAINLAWKLAFTLRGRGGVRLLDSYEAERRPAARHNLDVTGATMRFLVPGSPWHRLWRALVLRGAVRLRAARRFVNSGKLSEPAVYQESALIMPKAGQAVENAPTALGRSFVAVASGVDRDVFASAYDADPPDAPCELVFADDWPRGVHVVRPDGHLAAHVDSLEGDGVGRLVAFACGQGTL